MRELVDKYIEYLQTIKHSSVNTVASYRRDLLKLVSYLDTEDCENISDDRRVNEEHELDKKREI